MTDLATSWLEQQLGFPLYLPTPEEHPAQLRHKLLQEHRYDEVVIFGTGSGGVSVYSTLKQAGVKVKYFLDNSPSSNIEGTPAYLPKDKPTDNLPIILCSVWHMEIYDQLRRIGVTETAQEIIPLSLPLFLTGNDFDDMIGWGFHQILQARLADFQHVHSILDDQHSKDTFLKILAYRLAAFSPASIDINNLPCPPERYRNESKTSPIVNEELPPYLQAAIRGCFIHPQYYLEGFLQPRVGDTVFDCGAWRGDSSYWFNSLIGEQGHVYAFEPDPKNFSILCEQLPNFPHPGAITAIDLAVSDRECILHWSELSDIGTDSRLTTSTNNSSTEIQATSIDAFCTNNNIKKVDFIKTDLEGADFDAIIGAENIIHQHHPDLGISIYHTPNHLVDIPLWIHQKFPDYKIRIHHNFIGFVETICMATQRTDNKQ